MRNTMLILMTAFVLSTATAGTENFVFDINGRADITLENIAGEIKIVKGSDNRVLIDADKSDDRIKVEVSAHGNNIRIKTRYPSFSNTHGGVDFVLTVPATSDLDIGSVSGDIEASGVSGRLRLNTVSGNIELTDASGDLSLQAVSGDIHLVRIGEADLDAVCISGDVTYREGSLNGDSSFSSTSGDIEIEHSDNASYRVSGRTVNGRISTSISGLEVTQAKYTGSESISGSFNGGDTSLDVNTVSGRIRINQR